MFCTQRTILEGKFIDLMPEIAHTGYCYDGIVSFSSVFINVAPPFLYHWTAGGRRGRGKRSVFAFCS